MKHTIILTAGGTGKRMGGKIPKQFLKINDTPILIHTLKRIYEFEKEDIAPNNKPRYNLFLSG